MTRGRGLIEKESGRGRSTVDDESGQGRSTREYVRRYVGRDWESTITITANWQTTWGSMARELLLANRQLPVLNAKTCRACC